MQIPFDNEAFTLVSLNISVTIGMRQSRGERFFLRPCLLNQT